MTFSIVARSADGESWGIAVASKFLAVGSAVPAAVAGVGAIATQAFANVAYKGLALAHLDEGATASVALQRLLEEDDGRDHRQVGIVDVDGGAASHTGSACLDWAGGLTGDGYAIQGNILTGSEVVEAMEEAFLASDPELPLERRLLAALRAGDEAGGDSRGRQSVAVLVVREGAGYGGFDDVAVDLRVDDHESPVPELERLVDLHALIFGTTAEEDRVPVDATLLARLDAFAVRQGKDDFGAWVGAMNLEMKVADDLTWVDREVLELVDADGGTTTATD